jgi:hypothetical protein
VRSWLFLPLVLLVMTALLLPLFYFAGLISDAASPQCPGSTFLSGAVHSFWKAWSVVILGTALAMAVMSYLMHFHYFPEHVSSRFIPWPWPRWGIVAFSLFLIAGTVGVWITHASQFCLARDAIYHRVWPWQVFQRHRWTDLARIDVSCANRRREPDLNYILTMKDGRSIDIADAFPNLKGLAAFDHQLVGSSFSFTADVRKGCPDYFAEWVGQKP